MKQIILPFNTGKPLLAEVPAPSVQAGHVLIRTTASVVSSGTERMLLGFGKAGWIGKALQQPERVKQVFDKIKTDGIAPTIKAVKSKLDNPIPLGYSQAGIVLAIGEGIADIRIGDRVASNGAHAEVVSVSRNLVARIPDEVPDEEAAFTVLGAIALQGIRLAGPTLGETVMVFGLGLIGQLTAQLLLANGCRVFGTDLHPQRMHLAANKGVQVFSNASGESVRALTGGYGVDAVIITASSDSDEVIAVAADMCRKRGRIVLTGVVPLNLSRDHFFKKELTFQVSASYGPGRYESEYEEHGLDYPIGYVRWTEGRNFDAVLQAMKMRQLDVAPLITQRKPLESFGEAYESLDNTSGLATVFIYSETPDTTTLVRQAKSVMEPGGEKIAIIGAGNFTSAILLPALASAGSFVQAIVSKNGLSASTLAAKHGIPQAGTDYETMLADQSISAVFITTPHNTHATITAAALSAGKHVFVEKPLALSRVQASEVQEAFNSSGGTVTIGFNRRFAPLAVQARSLMESLTGPMNTIITVNAGAIPRDHWIQDAAIGGGRILGEACHFIDLCKYFTGSRIVAVCANAMGDGNENASILLRFSDGSNATVNYFSNGSKAYDKERVELYRSGHTVIIENWRSLRSYGFKKNIHAKSTQDKGHVALITSWVKSMTKNCHPLIPMSELMNSTLATLAVEESIAQSGWISL